MNKSNYTSYNTSFLLKKAGYDLPCQAYYHTNCGDESFESTSDMGFDFLNCLNMYRIGSIYLLDAQDWVSKSYKYFIEPCLVNKHFYFKIIPLDSDESIYYSENYFTNYKEALDGGINYFLKVYMKLS